MSKLYVVATPIGNLSELTPRAGEILKSADLIVAEDTRVTMKLTEHLGVKKAMTASHRHNEGSRAPALTQRMLQEDLTVALVCDAGTPGISDPGAELVRACREAGIPIAPVAGPSAVAAAISVCGYDARAFAFYGFLPRERADLLPRLKEIAACGPRVFVAYESPHRIVHLIKTMAELWPQCRTLVCSDMTKRFERFYEGPAGEVARELTENPNVEKGEYCVVVDLGEAEAQKPEFKREARYVMLDRLLEGDAMDEAAAAAAREGFSRNEIYRARLALKRLFEAD